MPLSFPQVKDKVHKRLGREVVDSIRIFVEKEDVSLWGLNKNSTFLKKSVYIALFKDIKNIGINKLKKEIATWYAPTIKTLNRNIQTLREVFARWGEAQITIGNKEEWDASRNNYSFAKNLKKVNLWMDSVDFGLMGKRSIRKKSDAWSYKLNSPGRRFQIIMDGSTRIRSCVGPYSPKIHDSTWLEMNKKFVKKFQGGVIVADCHYSYGRKNFSDPKFHVPYTQQSKKYTESIIYNAEIRKIRGIVESPFGEMKQRFKALRKQFYGSPEQLSYLIFTAVGIHNFKLINLN